MQTRYNRIATLKTLEKLSQRKQEISVQAQFPGKFTDTLSRALDIP